MQALISLSALAPLAMLPASAFAVDYLSAEQAAQAMFGDADRFEQRELVLDAGQLQALAAAGVAGRSARWPARLAWQGKRLLGVVVVDAVVGKFELISYAVGISLDGSVKQVRSCPTAKATAMKSACRPGAASLSARRWPRRCGWATTLPTSAAPPSAAAM